jgi:acetamidase/formamidase
MMNNTMPAGANYGHWGYWYDLLEPRMVVNGSGSIINVEMPTFVAGTNWEEMGKNDPGMEDLYAWTDDGPAVKWKGPNGTTGGHWMAGPIYVCGAEPGDVLQVDIIDLQPRKNPQNESYGTTTNFGIGWWNRVGYITEGYNATRNGAILFKAIYDNSTGRAIAWEPVYAFDNSDPRMGNVTTPGCLPQSAPMPGATPAGAAVYNNTDYNNTKMFPPCINNTQTWQLPAVYSGLKYDPPMEVRDYSIQGKFRLPINMHIGNMGLAPAVGAPVSTSPPMRSGGNLDNKRIGIGATMYYPVEVAGALLSMGDCHGHQGDGESAATGVETSLNGQFRIILHKANNLPKKVQLLDYPLLENANEHIIHGYAYRDWLREIPNPQNNVGAYGPLGGVDMNRAQSVVYNETREFLINYYGITEDTAINVMSHLDFQITQIVDSNVGIQARIPKWIFDPNAWQTQPYYEAKVMDGTSRTAYP